MPTPLSVTDRLAQETEAALRRRKAEIEYLAQMSALEGLAMPVAETEEHARIARELERRGLEQTG